MPTDRASDPIGVFDSGIGGLTVAASLQRLLPSENILYIGDTARVPYGGKSRRTIERYSVEIGGLLLADRAKILVVACNTASALAVPVMQEFFNVPVQGVVAPGASAAVTSTKTKKVGVIGTRATIASGAYEHAIHAIDPSIEVHSTACPLLVPLIEEGLFEDSVTDQMLRRYLDPILAKGIDTLVLGCTHYPLLKPAIARVAGQSVRLVDSAENCAQAVRRLLDESHLAAPTNRLGKLDVALTDATEGFLRTAARALDLEIGDVALKSVQPSSP
jgi:glutamate racemase